MNMNKRQMKILESLSNLEILTRGQIQALHDTKGTRNTNYIMQRLNSYTLSLRLKNGYAYYLNKKGRELTGTKRQYRPNDQLNHKLMLNDAYIYFKPTKWYPEREFLKPVKIIPDAFFYSSSSYKFLEVYNTQKMNVNKTKFESYKRAKDTSAFQNKYGYFPSLIWVTKFESRKGKLKELARKNNLFCEVYLHDEVVM